MNHIFCGEISACRDDRLPRWAAALPGADGVAFLHNLWTASAVNRPIDAAPAREVLIGGVDNGINVFLRNISLNKGEKRLVDFGFHRFLSF
jgi:hypothetical protein